ncbi:hypothetical protein CSOJ01_16009, partial [Colletotrichum sojae]
MAYQVVMMDETAGGVGNGQGPRSRLRSRSERKESELGGVEEGSCEMVRDWLRQGGGGKTVTYSSTIEGVERMAKALVCAAFYSSIGTTESKTSRLEAWRRGDGAEGGVIVATKALGLGIDVADVRGEVCRRMVLDEVMDGRVDRSGCDESKEACDICQQKVSDVWDGGWDWDEGEGEGEGEGERIREAFETSQQTGWFLIVYTFPYRVEKPHLESAIGRIRLLPHPHGPGSSPNLDALPDTCTK